VTAKTVIFHSLEQARAARAAAAECDAAITLQTAPGAAVYGGVGYLAAIVDQAGASGDEAVIDCGEDAGIAQAALRAGWKRILFRGAKDIFDKLDQMAAQRDARMVEPQGAALDLLDAPDAAAAVRNYLRADPSS